MVPLYVALLNEKCDAYNSGAIYSGLSTSLQDERRIIILDIRDKMQMKSAAV